MEVVLIFGLLAIIPAIVAKKKGKRFGVWWLYGLFFWPIALIHSLLAHRTKRCKDCAAEIRFEARVCGVCGAEQWSRHAQTEQSQLPGAASDS